MSCERRTMATSRQRGKQNLREGMSVMQRPVAAKKEWPLAGPFAALYPGNPQFEGVLLPPGVPGVVGRGALRAASAS